MEEAYEKIKESGFNSVKGLTDFIKKSGLVEDKVNVKKLFKDVEDPEDVDYDKFKSVLETLSKKGKYGVDEMSRKLAEQSTKFMADSLEEQAVDSEEEKDDE